MSRSMLEKRMAERPADELGFWSLYEANPDACLSGPHGTDRGVVFARWEQVVNHVETLANADLYDIREWRPPEVLNLAQNMYLTQRCRLCSTLAYLWEHERTRATKLLTGDSWQTLRLLLRRLQNMVVPSPCPACKSERMIEGKHGPGLAHEPDCLIEELGMFWARHSPAPL